MKIYDISMEISHEMPVYKGRTEKRPVFKIDNDFNKGSAYETRLEMNLHTGTHLDAPLHMIEDGKNLDGFDLDKVITKCKVIDLTHVAEKVSKTDLEAKEIQMGDFILLKTRNSIENILEKDFIYLDKSGAEYLSGKKVKGVGIDALGIERAQPGHETHKILFSARIVILEGLKLDEVNEGEYFLFAAPVKIKGVEASPVRAVLIVGM
ncbi:MAG: cyclase family protein [Acetivibrionales bacterium]|jgi:arylformamidase|nr:cyclase family protein [Clostridiaceae bacterium]